MPRIRIATFNVENLLQRFNFHSHGRLTKERSLELLGLDKNDQDYMSVRKSLNVGLTDDSRQQSAQLVRDTQADIIAVQEVENLNVLNVFHNRYIKATGAHYGWRRLIEGNDMRGIDVGVMSKRRISVKSHKEIGFDDLDLFNDEIAEYGLSEGDRIFRRDCLEVEVKVGDAELTLFICHFKSMSGGRERTRCIREAEAKAVRILIEQKFGKNAPNANWMILGDLNDYIYDLEGNPDSGTALTSLFEGGFSVNLFERLAPQDRWTHYWAGANSKSQIDHMFVSPTLGALNKDAQPQIIRYGQPYRVPGLENEKRYPRIGFDRPKASDHCPAVVDLEVLP